MRPDGSKRTTLLFMHENAGNLGLRMDYFSMLYHELGYNILAFAYRGYSDSTLENGSPSEHSIRADAQNILSFIRQYKVEGEPVLIMGRSLGGAVATYMVSLEENLFHGLILENTFTSLPDVLDNFGSIFKGIRWLFVNNKWDSKVLMSGITIPILFVAGKND